MVFALRVGLSSFHTGFAYRAGIFRWAIQLAEIFSAKQTNYIMIPNKVTLDHNKTVDKLHMINYPALSAGNRTAEP